jgi:hypothetical protein
MTMSLDAAAQVMCEAMREKVKRHSLWYLVQGGVMILAGILALVYPVVSSFAAVFALGCLLRKGSVSSTQRGATFLASACLGRAVGDRRGAFDSAIAGQAFSQSRFCCSCTSW